MRRRRFVDTEEPKDNPDRWMLTYSDMITLLLTLFIILYGMSSLNTKKFSDMSKGLEKALNNPVSESVQNPGATGAQNLDKIYQTLKQYIDKHDLEGMVDLSSTGTTVTIHLQDTMLFRPNTAQMLSESDPVLRQISDSIQLIYKDISHVTITGNTADLGNRDAANEADSWQLSVDRAVAVLNEMTGMGVAPDKLSIEGNSHYRPIASNATEEGRAKNRRVEITIEGTES